MACADADVDVTLLRETDLPAGRCLSIVRRYGDDEVQREMATFPGANRRLFAHLIDTFWTVVDDLSSAKYLHVASVFDSCSPQVLALIVERVVHQNPDIVISFDPGHVWASRTNKSAASILSHSSLLFTTEEELALIATAYTKSSRVLDEEPQHAQVVMQLLNKGQGSVIVVKHRGATTVYEPHAPAAEYSLDELASDVEDDTGAGDAFAAGYLLALLNGGSSSDGAHIGMELARAKLAQVGPPNAAVVREIARRHLPRLAVRPAAN